MIKYHISNELARKNHYLSIGETLKLKGKNGKTEIYTLKEYIKGDKLLKFIDEQKQIEVFLKSKAAMQKPLADGERKNALDDTDSEINNLEKSLRRPAGARGSFRIKR